MAAFRGRVLTTLSHHLFSRTTPPLFTTRRPGLTDSLFSSLTERNMSTMLSRTSHKGFSAVAVSGAQKNYTIQTEETPNPSSLKFIPVGVEGPVLDSISGMDFTSDTSHNSPLVTRLFQIDGVVGVYFGNDFITVRKSSHLNWDTIQTHISDTIRDFFAEGIPVMEETPLVEINGDGDGDGDDEVSIQIKDLLTTRIRASIQADGGDIFFEKFDPTTGIVYVRLAGACTGCPSSTITLKYSVENMLKHYIPEVKGIHQIENEEDALQYKLSFFPETV